MACEASPLRDSTREEPEVNYRGLSGISWCANTLLLTLLALVVGLCGVHALSTLETRVLLHTGLGQPEELTRLVQTHTCTPDIDGKEPFVYMVCVASENLSVGGVDKPGAILLGTAWEVCKGAEDRSAVCHETRTALTRGAIDGQTLTVLAATDSHQRLLAPGLFSLPTGPRYFNVQRGLVPLASMLPLDGAAHELTKKAFGIALLLAHAVLMTMNWVPNTQARLLWWASLLVLVLCSNGLALAVARSSLVPTVCYGAGYVLGLYVAWTKLGKFASKAKEADVMPSLGEQIP